MSDSEMSVCMEEEEMIASDDYVETSSSEESCCCENEEMCGSNDDDLSEVRTSTPDLEPSVKRIRLSSVSKEDNVGEEPSSVCKPSPDPENSLKLRLRHSTTTTSAKVMDVGEEPSAAVAATKPELDPETNVKLRLRQSTLNSSEVEPSAARKKLPAKGKNRRKQSTAIIKEAEDSSAADGNSSAAPKPVPDPESNVKLRRRQSSMASKEKDVETESSAAGKPTLEPATTATSVKGRRRQSSAIPKQVKKKCTHPRFTNTDVLFMWNFVLDMVVDEAEDKVTKFPAGPKVWEKLVETRKDGRSALSYHSYFQQKLLNTIDNSDYDIQTKALFHYALEVPCTEEFLKELSDAGGDYLLDNNRCLIAFRKLDQDWFDLWHQVWEPEHEEEFKKQPPKREPLKKKASPEQMKDVPSTSAQ